MGVKPKQSVERCLRGSDTMTEVTSCDSTHSESFDVSKTKSLDDLRIVASYVATYWKKGASLPVEGRLFITTESLEFKPLFGGEKKFSWTNLSIEKYSTLVAIKNGIRVTATFDDGTKKTYNFTILATNRDSCFKKMKMMIIREESKHQPEPAEEREDESASFAAVAPDEILAKMEPILKTKLKSISVRDFYEIVWSEGNGTNRKPLYGPWLSASGKNDVSVGDWEKAKDAVGFVQEFSGERYDQKRVVTFNFQGTFGNPEVTHTQYCRIEGNDRCILAMTVNMKGIPFSDCFQVEVRWVASRVGTKDLSLQAGLFVNFKKSCIVAGKIRKNTTLETTKGQTDLCETMKKACYAVSGTPVDEGDDEEEEEEEIPQVASRELTVQNQASDSRIVVLWLAFVSFVGRLLGLEKPKPKWVPQGEVEISVKIVQDKLEKVIELLNNGNKKEREKVKENDHVKSEILQVDKSLERVLKHLK